MRNTRTAVAVVAFVLFAFSAPAATCPTAAPPYYQNVAYSGVNCASNLGGPCGIAQPIAFTLSVPSYIGVLESCDVVTWQYGDGITETMAPGVFIATHTYASAGNYNVYTSITNSLGTQSGIYSPTVVAVANGYMQFFGNNYYPGYTVNEGAAAVVTVQRTTGAGVASLHYATSDSTAFAGQQYTATSGTLTFANGEVQKTFTVPSNNDHVFHINGLSFNVTLSSPTGGFLLNGNTTATVLIVDTDPRPLLSFESQSYTTTEDAGSVTIRVLRSGDLNPVVSVGFFIGGSTATVSSNGVLTFFAGDTTKTITVPIIDDDVWDGDRQVYISLSNATNGAGIVGTSSVPLTVKDNEQPPTLSFQDVSVIEGNSGTKTVTLTAALSAKTAYTLSFYPFSINGSARAGIDYNFAPAYLTIPAGQLSTTVDAQIIGNTKVEVNKTFQISVSGYLNYPTLLTVRPGTVTILNDDGNVTPSQLSIATGGTSQVFANFGAPPASPQLVKLSSSDPSVASVVDSVSVTSSSLPIDVVGKSAGHATITTIMPAAYGGGTYTTDVNVFNGAVVMLSPSSVSLPVGGTATISASISPALDTSEGASLRSAGTGAITMPDRVIIDAGGSSTFTITGTRKGLTQLIATLGANHGNSATTIFVDVNDPPTTPTISQVSPANGPASGGTNITVNGANLRAGCTIRFGGVPATSVTFVSASSMTAVTPEHAAGASDVTLSCGADTFNFASGFTFLATSASLSSIAPSFGTTAGNTVVKITGNNLASGCWPFFDGIAARSASVTGSTEMIAATPPHAAATVPLMLRCNGVLDASLANAFTYTSAAESSPVITGVDPLIGSAGKTVTISGARFRYDDAVTFDTTPATILSTSPGTHVVRVPEMGLGKTSINVTDLAGHLSTTGPIFSIVEPQSPAITSVSPTTARPANEIAIDGSGFRPGYTFTIGDQPSPLVSMTYARVVLRVPQLAAGTYGINILNAAGKVAVIGPQFTVAAAGLAVRFVTPACATTDGGVRMTIMGTSFATGAVVTFDGAVAPGAIVADPQTIIVMIQRLPTGMPRIVVTNPNGDAASLSNAFSVTSPFDPNGCTPRPRPSRH